jgi:predicted exporter
MGVEEFIKSPLGKIHNQLWLGKLDDNYYSIVSLYGYMDLASLNKLASLSPDINFIDRSASVSHIFKKYRIKIEKMFPVVILVVFLLLSWRYGVTGSFRVVSAPLVSALLSFLLMNLITGEYNLFVIFGLVITVAISIDYAVFIRESKGNNESTYLAISLASLTTVLALGLLSLSHTPALSFFGLSLLFGVLISFVLTPLIVKPAQVGK